MGEGIYAEVKCILLYTKSLVSIAIPESPKSSPRLSQVIERDDSGAISRLEGVTNLEGNFKTTKWKLTWLAKSEELIPLTLVDFDHLLTKKKLEDDDDILDLITPCSVSFPNLDHVTP